MALSDELLKWYAAHRRILPWRETPTPYRVLVSEIMLQQTRVDTVVPYFLRFMERFPSFDSLAAADEDQVLDCWKGLGYYSRARNLHHAAKDVVTCFGGTLPDEEKSLRSLSGIGPYVSSAVLAIAFNLPYVAVDGNLLRVYARLNALPIDPNSAKAKKDCAEFFLANMQKPADFNQALMDLGELVCLPHGAPRCAECPFRARCKAAALGTQTAFPAPKTKKVPRQEHRIVMLVMDDQGRVAVLRRGEGLLAHMDEFPNALAGEEPSTLFPYAKDIAYLGQMKHRFSHIEWTMSVYRARGEVLDARYVPLEEIKKAANLPTAFLKVLTLL